jgi:hypothetical protein
MGGLGNVAHSACRCGRIYLLACHAGHFKPDHVLRFPAGFIPDT